MTAADRLAEGVRVALAAYESEQATAQQQTTNIDPAVERIMRAARVRREWKEIEAEIPGIIADACALPMWSPQTVAALLDVTDSYVYRKLREQRATQQ